MYGGAIHGVGDDMKTMMTVVVVNIGDQRSD